MDAYHTSSFIGYLIKSSWCLNLWWLSADIYVCSIWARVICTTSINGPGHAWFSIIYFSFYLSVVKNSFKSVVLDHWIEIQRSKSTDHRTKRENVFFPGALLSTSTQGFKSRPEPVRKPRLPVRTGSGFGWFQTGPNSKFKFEFKKIKNSKKISKNISSCD